MVGVCEDEGHLSELLRTRRVGRSTAAALTLILLVVAAGGCGQNREFTAEEFVEDVKAEGVELRLGDELFSDDESQELYALELEQVAKLPGTDGNKTGGSLSVFEDTDGADEKVTSCKATADLLCFQASNVVVVLEGGGIEAQQLAVAIERLSEQD